MRSINQAGRYSLGLFFLLVMVVSCAPLPHLNVLYRLPSQAGELEGRAVFLAIEDERKVSEILGKGARREFGNLSENISFSLARGSESGFKIGVYDLPALYREAFIRRLETSGTKILPMKGEGRLELVIAIQDFSLDLVKKNWKVQIGYEARLVKDGRVLAKQMISGDAERLKVIGRKQADVVLGELFTDTLNRLDLDRLFHLAGM